MNVHSPTADSKLSLNAAGGLLLFAIFLAAAWLRNFFAGEPLWIDELHTAWAIDSDLRGTADRAGQGNQTPLYFWLLWAGQSFFGFSHSLLRLPSVACGLLAMGIACWLTWRFARCWTAILVVASILAVDGYQLYYSSEARPYALLQLIAIFQIACVACFSCTARNKNLFANLLIAFSTYAVMLTHITGIWLVAAELVFFASVWRRSPQPRLLGSVISGLLVTLLRHTLLFLVVEHRSDWWVASNSSLYFWQIGVVLLGQWLIPMVGWLVARQVKHSSETNGAEPVPNSDRLVSVWDRRTYVILILCVSIIPISIVSVLQIMRIAPVASIRYAFIAMIPLTLCCGMLIASIKDRWIRSSVAAMVLVSTLVFNPVFMNVVDTGQLANMRNENWTEAAKQLEKASLVFLLPNLIEDIRLKSAADGKLELGTFDEYLGFPLSSPATPKVSAIIVPLPTLADKRWTKAHLDLIQQHQSSWIVMRASRKLAAEICHEFQALAADHNVALSLEILEQDRNDVRLAKIEFAAVE